MEQKQIRMFWLCALIAVLGGPWNSPSVWADDDMPPPLVEEGDGRVRNPPPQEFLDTDPALPRPDAGDDVMLPDPEVSRAQERDRNQVNVPQGQDEIFLPTPQVQDNVNYTPLGSPVSSRTRDGDDDWRLGLANRPAFSFQAGVGFRSYLTTLVPTAYTRGYHIGSSVRVWDIGQTVFLHAYGALTWFNLGDVGPYDNLKDRTLHFGPMLEVGIGRRFSLYGSFLNRSNKLSTGPGPPRRGLDGRNQDLLIGVGEPAGWQLGAGAQLDFYIIPHGSLGVKAHVERDYFVVALTMALEPKPTKRLQLNTEGWED
jgi:hypothetical protein